MVWEEGHWLPWGVGGESLGDMSLRENGKRGNGKTTPEIFAEVLKDKGESVCGRDSIQTRMLHSQPSHCLQEGGGEEMALKKIDGVRLQLCVWWGGGGEREREQGRQSLGQLPELR